MTEKFYTSRLVPHPEAGYYTDIFYLHEGRYYSTRLPYPAGVMDVAREAALFLQRRKADYTETKGSRR